MLNFSAMRRIFVARQSTDMRRGIDTLVNVVATGLGQDPCSGDCFIFIGRDRRRLKVLVWEPGGFWLGLKRLEAGTFPLPAGWETGTTASVTMSPAQVHALLEGIEVRTARYRKRWSPPHPIS
jgi:transposase